MSREYVMMADEWPWAVRHTDGLRPAWILVRALLVAMAWALPVDCQDPVRPPSEPTWQRLFDGKSLANWETTRFGGEGRVTLDQGVMALDMGAPLTGVHWVGNEELPVLDYEIHVEARRVAGSDFFCGLTFPYKNSHASLILGGWGGGLVGLSSLDGQDASENETTHYAEFEQGRWYQIRLRVRDDHIEAWIDDRKVVDCDVAGRAVSTRPEVSLSRPLGVAAYETRAEIRAIQLRKCE